MDTTNMDTPNMDVPDMDTSDIDASDMDMTDMDQIIVILRDLQSSATIKLERELITRLSEADSLDYKYIFSELEAYNYLDMFEMEEEDMDIFGVFINSLAALSEHIRYSDIPNVKYIEPLPQRRKTLIYNVVQILMNKFPKLIPNHQSFISACEYGLFEVTHLFLTLDRDFYFKEDNSDDLNKRDPAELNNRAFNTLGLGAQNGLYRAINSKDENTCKTESKQPCRRSSIN